MPDVMFKARDGSGSFSAYVARPAQLPAPGLILIQEIFGVNEDMRRKADDYASQGYLVVVPDLFWRQEPGVQLTDKSQTEWDRAFALMNGFDLDKGMDDLAATLGWLRAEKDCTGKAGCIGYCLGGRLAVLMAARTDIDAAVSYYGVYLAKHLDDIRAIRQPLLMHVAEKDKFAPPEVRALYEPMFRGLPSVEYHLYEGQDHAFARRNGDHFNAAAATLANERTQIFLDRHLK